MARIRRNIAVILSGLAASGVLLSGSAEAASLADIYSVNPSGTHAPWGTLRSGPSSFAIGNAADGWEFDVTYRNGNRSWYYGQISGGGFSKCAWIASSNLDNDLVTTPAACGSTGTTFAASSFAAYVNCDGSVPTPCTDGSLITTSATAGCTDNHLYANVLPWRTVTAAQDPVDTFTPGTAQVYWRYRTRDDAWIMVRVPWRAADQGHWLFMQRACLPNASGYPASTWD